ncbi:PREDICTED: uncharacterized protein LOC109236274 [Nicotiana attenuata]|uniref:Uncharacterized protein n=1 Tax=Nicotiana attenuata TaxID=49451 RepID=A0A1J6HVN1_NICAT|nr:PREDICTED: uncharacterized protein LOC109236274 [Nicotiana attenuata]OIS96457.1 hypothetical protein A4A49_05003 [Nicotiana attenuata]
MDLEIPISSQALTSIDEFEDLELVTQFDENTLRELLEEEPNYDIQEDIVDCVIQPMVIEMAPNDTNIEEGELIDDFEWLEMMELSHTDTTACPEGVNEIFDVGEFAFDFSHFCSAVPLEEIGYDVLWQDSS